MKLYVLYVQIYQSVKFGLYLGYKNDSEIEISIWFDLEIESK